MGTKLRLARFTLETMDIWQIIVFVVLAALVVAWVAIIAYNKGRVPGVCPPNKLQHLTRPHCVCLATMFPYVLRSVDWLKCCPKR